ncbi:MAG: hypothetical protein WC484_02495 [Candidatus Omnitrophota bacterium]
MGKTIARKRDAIKKIRGYLIGRSFSKESPLNMIQRVEKTNRSTKYKALRTVSDSTELKDERARGRRKINIPSIESMMARFYVRMGEM